MWLNSGFCSVFLFNAAGSTSDDQLESSFADSECETHCPALSTDSDPTVTGYPSCQRGNLRMNDSLK